MKKYIFAASLAAMVAFQGFSQGKNLVVTTTDDEQHAFDTEKIEKVIFSNDLKSYPVLISAEYNTSSTLGVYTVTIGNEPCDGAGLPSSIGGSQIVLSFCADMAEDPQNAGLPDGKYVMGNGSEAGTFNIQKSAVYLRTGNGDEGVEMMPIVFGEVEVLNVGGNYVLNGTLSTLQGFNVEFIYNGMIQFTPSLAQSSPFDSDLSVTFEGAQMRFYGNWFTPFSDDLTLQLYTGEFSDAGQIEGYWLNIDLYMPKVLDPWSKNIVLADGVYNVEFREKPENSSYLPFTYMPGAVQDVFGIEMPTGTYITHRASDGLSNLGLVKSGTITVSENGKDIKFNLVMANGKRLTGGYKGNVVVGNFHDADMPSGVEMLDSDVDLDFLPGTVAISYNDGHSILEDINTYMVMIVEPNMEKGEYLSLFLLTDKEELPDGTYNMGVIANNGGLKGSIDYGGGVIYSWYADLDSTDEEGYQSVMAPLESGTITISTIDQRTRKFDFNLTTKEGRKITGTFQGLYMDYADLAEKSPRKAPLKVKRIKK
ncbi:MAG: hypothetical protein K2N05_05310 [Muribaculaceae bacterium]|nr:hypothetical protein [Muribaculaceae bacterium]